MKEPLCSWVEEESYGAEPEVKLGQPSPTVVEERVVPFCVPGSREPPLSSVPSLLFS